MIFPQRIEEYRLLNCGDYSSRHGDRWGAFYMPGPSGTPLRIMASDAVDDIAEGWEHVSVSTERRIPNWIEMCFVKNLFWLPEDCVVQFHPPQSRYINCHPKCLHLWKWTRGDFPMPPTILVGTNP